MKRQPFLIMCTALICSNNLSAALVFYFFRFNSEYRGELAIMFGEGCFFFLHLDVIGIYFLQQKNFKTRS